MVPTGTGFRDHYRTRVKKNIDFGEIGKGTALSPAALDAQMEALISGDIDPLAPRQPSPALARTGTEPGAEPSGQPRPAERADELLPAERPDGAPVDPFDVAMGSSDAPKGSGTLSESGE
jgi:hypothetical protein